MRLYIKHALSGDYVYFIESYRDSVTRKPKSRIVRSFGRLEELTAAEPDVLTRLQHEVNKINAETRDSSPAAELDLFLKESLSSDDYSGATVLNYGILCYRSLWDELGLEDALCSMRGFSSGFNRAVFLMSALRNMCPCSKIATFKKRGDYLFDFEKVDEHDMYRSLSFLSEHKDSIEKHLYRKLYPDETAGVRVAFYDVTTYYFESVSADGMKDFGFSKDHRVNEVQVVMGLLIDADGMPLCYDLYPGNTSEFKTLLPVLKTLKKRYKIKKIIITADRGLNSKSNLALIKKMGFEYVMAYKLRCASSDVIEQVLSEEGYTYLGPADISCDKTTDNTEENANEDTDTTADVSIMDKADVEVFKYKTLEHTQVVRYDKKKIILADRLIVSYSSKRAEKDRKDRERLIKKAEKLVANPSSFKAELKKGGKSLVIADIDSDSLSVDTDKIARQSMLDGYYCIISSNPQMSTQETIAIHRRLWKIEESFRVLKSSLRARPCFVWTEKSIRGHFVMCYIALVMQRLMEKKLKQAKISASTNDIHDAIRGAEVTVVKTTGRTIYIKNANAPLYDEMSQVLGMSPLKYLSTKGDLQTMLHRKVRQL